jgi:glycosyltransferase involved in cell wall biosynthesis
MREFLRDTLGVPEARIRHIIYGIDGFYPPSTEEKLAARASLGLPNDAWVASLVGQYEYRKGQDVLIDAMGLLKRRGVPLVVVCAGEHHNEKTYKEGLLEQAGRLGVLESLVLLGHRESREVFHASDFVVLPSRLEGFGLVIAEGMMCGAIPIRTPAAGARETVQDGKTGFIIPFDDPAALADRIETLIRSSELRKAMRSNAIAYAREHFTAARMAAETLRVYEEALAEDLKQ